LITKVFHNLIGNALLHGQKVSRVQFSLEEGTGCSSIVCSDDGIGLAEKTRKSLFMPGFNRDHGMGLYLSKEILAITEISIREEGKQGNGARFVMSFPQDGVRMAKDALHI
jgi:K+-sensing histidine kinase KdpD